MTIRPYRAYQSRPYKYKAYQIITGEEPMYKLCKKQIEDNPTRYNYTTTDDPCSTVLDLALYNNAIRPVQVFDCYGELRTGRIAAASEYKKDPIVKHWTTQTSGIPNIEEKHTINTDCSETIRVIDKATGKQISSRTIIHEPRPVEGENGNGEEEEENGGIPGLEEITSSPYFIPGVAVAVLAIGGIIVFGMRR